MRAHEGAIALVTGSSKGIGAGIARHLAAAGFTTYVTHHTDQAGADEVAAEIKQQGGSARVASLDVSNEASVEALFGTIEEEHGRLDVLVNNAVKEVSKPIAEQTLEEWKTVLAVKLDGSFLCTRAALPLFEKSGKA
ncbi:MAG TPA: SDR family NAD(P)-dependent oxidoreductase, partial [Solirubrobacterales bacterium]|nr:SDR family NAD(P)-dependent oxidoreductase [Solirubrobacterales bacterium]